MSNSSSSSLSSSNNAYDGVFYYGSPTVDNTDHSNTNSNTLYVNLSNIQNKDSLMSVYAQSLKFPSYFGNNWDALNDMLADLSWLEQFDKIILIHENLPAIDNKQIHTYV